MTRKTITAAVIVFHLIMVLQISPLHAQDEQKMEPPEAETLRIVHEPVTEVTVQQPIGLTAELTGPVDGQLLYIMYRKMGKKNFRSKSMKNLGDNRFSGEIPAKSVTSVGLEYYLRVLDPTGHQLARYPVDESYVSVTVSPVEPVEEVALPEEKVAEEKPAIVLEEMKEDLPEAEETVSPQIPDRPEALKIVHEPVTEAPAKQPVVLTAELTGPVAGKLVYIMYRKMGKKDFRSKSMMDLGDNAFSGEIPAKQVTSEGLEYYLRVADPIGNELARQPEDESYVSVIVVSPVEPVEEVVLPEEKVEREKPAIVPEETKMGLKKWQWIGLGSLVVVGIAAFALSGNGDDGGRGEPPVSKLPDPPDRP